MTRGRIFHLQRFSVQDGPGIRTTAFLKGCPLSCAWCHNPESQSAEVEVATVEGRCIHCGACLEACPRPDGECLCCGVCVEACPTGARQRIGRDLEAAELVREVLRDRPFFEESGGGVTLSGGEPLMQADFAEEVLATLQDHGIHTALDTCGFAGTEDLRRVAARADLILFDLKLLDEDRHQAATGESNRPILENLKVLSAEGSSLWIRVPVVPGVNDDEENLAAIAHLAAATPGVQRVDLLPYHRTGAAKFARLGRAYDLDGVAPPSAERMAELAERLRRRGLRVTIGGRT